MLAVIADTPKCLNAYARILRRKHHGRDVSANLLNLRLYRLIRHAVNMCVGRQKIQPYRLRIIIYHLGYIIYLFIYYVENHHVKRVYGHMILQ